MKNSVHSFVLLVCLPITAAAQGPSAATTVHEAHQQNEAQTNPESAEVSDPLGRNTPHGTVFGFLQAAQNGKYKDAAQYLQLSKNERATEGERIAHQLYALMDDAFVERLGVINDHPEGSRQIGVPKDRERIGVFRINGSDTNVDLVRVSDPASGEIWLFSSQVLGRVPELFEQIENAEPESGMSRFPAVRKVLNTPLRSIMALVLLIPISVGLAWGIVRALRASQWIWMRWRHHPILKDIYSSLAAPATLILAVIFHQIGVYFLGAPLLTRLHYQRLTSIILIASVAWLVFRLINVWSERARARALEGSGYRSGSIILLGQRIFKVLAIIVAGLMMLSILGFEITTALAGLGIGSIAIAFAAQKTLENLLGGISILSDEVIRVGEICQIGDTEGTVEDISLRSTRIRTLGRTELSVPNGQLASMNVENISRRDKSLFRTQIGLRYETSPTQLRSLLAETRSLLYHHPKVDSEIVRVRFVGFGESRLDVEIFCYILTSNLDEFLAIREELLLRIMELVAESGAGLAIPSRVLYVTEGQDLDSERRGQTESASGLRRRAS